MKRSKGITILGYCEIVGGSLGTIALLYVFFGSFAALFFAKGEARMGFLALFLAPSLLPFPALAIAGIGLLKLRPWAPIVHIIIWSTATAIEILILANLTLEHYWSLHKELNLPAFILTIVALTLSITILNFIRSPSIKNQCRV
jgi:hypothetical protein